MFGRELFLVGVRIGAVACFVAFEFVLYFGVCIGARVYDGA